MAMILAFDVGAPRERWLVQLAGRNAGVKSARRRFASTEIALPHSITERVTVTRRSAKGEQAALLHMSGGLCT
jgi:hypothetical protein